MTKLPKPSVGMTMRWRPAHTDHAIERVVVTLSFNEAIPTKLWNRILDGCSTRLPSLGFQNVVDNIDLSLPPFPQMIANAQPGGPAVVVGPQGFAFSNPAAQNVSTGRTFQVLRDNQVIEDAGLFRSRFSYAVTRYPGWAEFTRRFLEIFADITDQALGSVDLSLLKLEYWDRFVFEGSLDEVDYTELLKPESALLPSFAHEVGEMWHSHIGYVAPTDNTFRRLINLNVDAINVTDHGPGANDEGERRSVGIYTLAHDTIDPSAPIGDMKTALSTLGELHTILKESLAETISDEAAQRISLYGRNPA